MTTDRYAPFQPKFLGGKALRLKRSAAIGAGLAALALLQGCASGPSGFQKRIDKIERLTRERAYIEAAEASVDLIEDTPTRSARYETALEAQRAVSLASQLDRARDLTLKGKDVDALDLLSRLRAEYPNTSQVVAWQERTRRKLADKWFGVAREALANETFDAARAAYRRVLEYDPNHPVAGLSLEDLKRLEQYRAELADDYYNSGVRGVVEQRLSEARTSFAKGLKYDQENVKAKRRISEVDRERSIARVASAEKLVKEKHYAAAAQEYQTAALLNPESEEIQQQVEALEAEARAFELKSEAEFQVLRGEIDRAEELLKEGAAMTKLQTADFEKAIAGIDGARIEKRYQSALDLEHDFRFPEAIEAYKGLLESRDFYKDTRARIDALEGYVASAERLYAEAAAATNDEAKLELLQQIDLFWPEYKDVADKIRALK
ncbi:hypothetical protein Poly30_17340 [Planctomycetes bacterium Poly30]|uniref:Uncharacterized protein n=1 Tax=Saltatorellus ferox TaxID=2528018 RepID=A0A518EQ56_9BACT|nr:hypothetical protein Poly30_17340 [Planctomycetes bacterium Poly30]